MLFHKHHLESLKRLLMGFESELIHMHASTKLNTRSDQVQQAVAADLHIFERLNNYMREEEHVLKKYMQLDDNQSQETIPQLMENLNLLETMLQSYQRDLQNFSRNTSRGLELVRRNHHFSRTHEIVGLIDSISSASREIAQRIKEEQQKLEQEKQRLEHELTTEKEIEHNIESWLF